jgi:hypothetical protein
MSTVEATEENMIDAQVLDNAVAAHSNWKTRLRSALSNGKFDGTSATVRVDNHCDFGKWLYGIELSAAEKRTEHYESVKQLHMQFHREAAKVVGCIIAGESDVADKAMALGGSYAKASSALTEAVIKWRHSLRP